MKFILKIQQYFYRYRETHFKIYMAKSRPKNTIIILEKNKVRGIILSKVKTYYMITIIRECSADGAMWINGTEERTQNYTNMPN